MPGERCRICAALVSFSDTAHVMLNPRDGTGISDHYVCRDCYDAKLASLFESDDE